MLCSLNELSMDRRAAWKAFIEHRFDHNDASILNLDYELALISKYEALAKKKRNTRNIACNIPDEITAIIYHHARSDMAWQPGRYARVVEKPASDGTGESIIELVPAYEAGWMSVVHVCDSWRRVSLQLCVSSHLSHRLFIVLLSGCSEIP